jgi:hypothetical protein
MLLTLTVNIGEPTFSVCCRRNMAAFEAKQADTTATGNPKLQLVTWLEPLFVGSVDITQISTGDALSLLNSQIHYYSMARLNRWFTFRHSRNTWASATSIIEKNRTMALKSPCMGTMFLYGHHYTHVFKTISAYPPFRIKRLSNEFVLESFGHKGDADIV